MNKIKHVIQYNFKDGSHINIEKNLPCKLNIGETISTFLNGGLYRGKIVQINNSMSPRSFAYVWAAVEEIN